MSIDVSTSIIIERPRDQVSAYAANPENAPKWYVNIKHAIWKTQPTVRVGSRVAFVAHFLGRKLEYLYEIVEHVPGERLVMRTAEGPFPMETTYAWQSLADGRTQMTLRNRGMPSGFSKLLAPFMAMAVRRATRKDLHRLKMLLERAL